MTDSQMENKLSSTAGDTADTAHAIDPGQVDALIFDLGGVVIDLKRENAVNALREIGLRDADRLLGLYRQEEPFLGIETGRLHVGEFFEIIRRQCPAADDVSITTAFNEFLVGIPDCRLRRLRELRDKGLKLYVLSNTNPVMYNSWIDRAFRAEGLAIGDYFDGIIASFQEHVCKPDTRIFEVLADRYGLDPARVLYLDDAPANVQAARSVGLQAVRVTPEHDMLAIIEEALNDRVAE